MIEKKVIAFEGPHASGKTSSIIELSKRLKNKGFSVDTLFEEDLFKGSIAPYCNSSVIESNLSPLTKSMFYLLAYTARINMEIPKLDSKNILVERYYFAPIILQYLALKDQGVKLEEVINFVTKPFGILLPPPSITFVLLAPPRILSERFYKREGRRMNDKEIKKAKDLIKYYRKFQDRFSDYHLLNTNCRQEELCNLLEKKLFENKIIKK